jgi:hypothetical protein
MSWRRKIILMFFPLVIIPLSTNLKVMSLNWIYVENQCAILVAELEETGSFKNSKISL